MVVHGSKVVADFWANCHSQLEKGLWAVGFLIFVLAFGEVAITILLIPPGSSTLPLKIFATIANSPDSVLASLCLFQTSVILVPLLIASAMVSAPAGCLERKLRGLCL